MALIKCSECGKEISDRARTCPGCGCPTNADLHRVSDLLNRIGGKTSGFMKDLLNKQENQPLMEPEAYLVDTVFNRPKHLELAGKLVVYPAVSDPALAAVLCERIVQELGYFYDWYVMLQVPAGMWNAYRGRAREHLGEQAYADFKAKSLVRLETYAKVTAQTTHKIIPGEYLDNLAAAFIGFVVDEHAYYSADALPEAGRKLFDLAAVKNALSVKMVSVNILCQKHFSG